MAVTELLYTDRAGACYGIFTGKFGTSVFIFPVLGRLSGKPHSSDTGSFMRRAEAWIGRKNSSSCFSAITCLCPGGGVSAAGSGGF